MFENQYRREGRHFTGEDIAERLFPDLNINEVMLWSPDLFAYTSYLLLTTSAYQLVVSPPSNEKWPPGKADIVGWLCDGAKENIEYWYHGAKGIKQIWGDGEDEDDHDFEGHYAAIQEWRNRERTSDERSEQSEDGKFREVSDWEDLVRIAGKQWREKLDNTEEPDFVLIDDCNITYEERRELDDEEMKELKRDREKQLLEILLRNTPPLLLACWAFFYREITDEKFKKACKLQITDLLCNQDHLRPEKDYCQRLWKVSQALLTMHAIADVTSEKFGIVESTEGSGALQFAERLLFGRLKYDPTVHVGGSLATFNMERCRVLPKRHNPAIGITLRSLSSNLAFIQSAVDVVWRKTKNNTLGDRLIRPGGNKNLSLLLFPFPLNVRAKDFGEDQITQEGVIQMSKDYGLFTYAPHPKQHDHWKEKAQNEKIKGEIDKAVKLIEEANKELSDDLGVDMIIFPEASLSLSQFEYLQNELQESFKDCKNKTPSIVIAGVRESRIELANEINDRHQDRNLSEQDFNFTRNAVYCQYFDKGEEDKGEGSYYSNPSKHSEITPKYKQYKHHRWQFDSAQIRRYGLSSVLDPKKIWWESIKIPKRRVSFLNVGDRITVSHLICEDLARQDPIAELIRYVGPSLVVAILMDGPQLRNRWSSRYATVLSDDPGCSVITLSSLGMVKRHQSEFGMMSTAVALWNDSSANDSREIELAQGAEAILLTLNIDETPERTADGRTEQTPTSVLKLNDVIQIYPNTDE